MYSKFSWPNVRLRLTRKKQIFGHSLIYRNNWVFFKFEVNANIDAKVQVSCVKVLYWKILLCVVTANFFPIHQNCTVELGDKELFGHLKIIP